MITLLVVRAVFSALIRVVIDRLILHHGAERVVVVGLAVATLAMCAVALPLLASAIGSVAGPAGGFWLVAVCLGAASGLARNGSPEPPVPEPATLGTPTSN